MLDFLSKIVLSLMFSIIIISSSNSNEIDCTKYKKLSTEYMECNAQKLKKNFIHMQTIQSIFITTNGSLPDRVESFIEEIIKFDSDIEIAVRQYCCEW